jgi:hypothetical protein
VRPDGVVVLAPLLDEDLGLLEAAEDFTVEQFVPQPAVEAFAIAVLPGAARLDVERLGAHTRKPATHDLGRHLRAVVGTDVLRDAAHEHHVSHVVGLTQAAAGADIRGRVEGQNRYSPNPFPIRGAKVELMDARGQRVVATSYAGQDGLYYFSNIQSGNYVVRVNGKYFPIVVRTAPKQDIAPVRVAL